MAAVPLNLTLEHHTINHSIDKLYENTLYIFSRSIIPTNDIPVVKYAQYMYIDPGVDNWLYGGQYNLGDIVEYGNNNFRLDADPDLWTIQWNTTPDTQSNATRTETTEHDDGTTDTITFTRDAWTTIERQHKQTIEFSRNSTWSSSSQAFNQLRGIKHFVKTTNGYNPNNYNIFACTQTNLMILSGAGVDSLPGNRDSVNVIQNSDVRGAPILSDSSITHPSNGIHFRDIRGVVLTDAKELFVLDGDHKQIFKFDVSGTIYLDPAILKNDTPGRLLTLMMGGDGDHTDKTNFLNPVKILTVNNLIYIVDLDQSTNSVIIKVFDSGLSWRESFNLGRLDDQDYIDFEYNFDTNRFYFLVHTSGNKPKLVTYDSSFVHLSTDELMDIDKHAAELLTEEYLKFVFSVENPNIYYILTRHNIFKKYLTKPLSFLGQFKLDEREIGPGPDLELQPTRSLQEIYIHPVSITDGINTLKKDEILLFESNYPGIYQFLEDSGYKQSFESTIETKLLPLKDIYIKPDEVIDTLTYNKMLYKLLHNNITMLQNISRKFSTQFDSKGFSRYVGFKYLNVNDLKTLFYEPSLDNYISSNEIVLAETVNRCLYKIYQLQERVLAVMQERSLNIYPLTDRPVILT